MQIFLLVRQAIELNLRDDFDPEYTVEGLNVKVEGNVLTFKADSSINPGKYNTYSKRLKMENMQI